MAPSLTLNHATQGVTIDPDHALFVFPTHAPGHRDRRDIRRIVGDHPKSIGLLWSGALPSGEIVFWGDTDQVNWVLSQVADDKQYHGRPATKMEHFLIRTRSVESWACHSSPTTLVSTI